MQGKSAQLSARVLPAGRRFDAWLELQVPDDSQHTNGDVFQVSTWSCDFMERRVHVVSMHVNAARSMLLRPL